MISDMRLGAFALALAAMATAVAPAALLAQDTAATNDAECASIAATLRRSPAALNRADAAAVLDCPDHGPQLLADLWSMPPADSAALSRLAGLSGRLQDARLFAAVTRAALRSDLSTNGRLHALASLVKLMHPCLAVAVVRTNVDAHTTRLTVMVGNVDHPGASRGRQPLSPSVWSDGLGVLLQASSDDSNAEVRAAADKLHKLLVNGVPCP